MKKLFSPNIELISQHIPKTAGATFLNLLKNIYGNDRVLNEDKDRILDPCSIYNIDPERWKTKIALDVKKINRKAIVLHGHFTANKYRAFFPKAKNIVWLRHPVDRLISHYYFWKSMSSDVSKHTIHKYMEKNKLSIIKFAQIPMMRNILSNFYLKGITLQDYDFIGIQEFFSEDLEYLKDLFGWSYDEKPAQINKNKERKYDKKRQSIHSDTKTIETLTDLNREDVDIYHEALQLREKTR